MAGAELGRVTETARLRAPIPLGNRKAMTVASLFDYSCKGATHYGGHAQELEEWLTQL